MPDDLLNLNVGQVQAVIDGYSDRLLDDVCCAVWTGYYASYFFSKHPKKPTEVIRQLLDKSSATHSTGRDYLAVDMEAELELYAQRDLKRFETTGGISSDIN